MLAKWLRRLVAAGFCAVTVLAPGPAKGIVFHATGDANHNTTAPTGDYEDSGWQWQGSWSLGSGTPISAKHFITAKHFTTASKFYFDGVFYDYEAHYNDPNSDLRIVEIQQVFPTWAPLYTKSDEVGKELVMYGRGYSRGDAVSVDGESKGWEWDASGQGTLRWGTNVVSGTADSGALLAAAFDADAGGDESHLALWDSGGGVFIKDGTAWRLAGVNFTVDGEFDENGDDDDSFLAALFDKGDLWEKTTGTWVFNTDTADDIPGHSYATRISENLAWIQSVIPEPGTAVVLGVGGLCIFLRRRRAGRGPRG